MSNHSIPSTDGLDRRALLKTGVAVAGFSTAGCLDSLEDNRLEDGERIAADGFEIETVATGLSHPWGIEFLPEDSLMLVTEREGQLNLIDRQDGTVEPIEGTPSVHTGGQGGLLDVAVHPEFPDQEWVYLTYSAANDDGETTTHLGRGRLDIGDARFGEFEQLRAADPFVDSTGHYGSRVVFGEDGMVYVTTGDRQFKDFGPGHVSQDTTNELGATLRLASDGSIPEDNPFVDEDGVRDSIFSYGHRNSQGMTVHPETGELWQSEHGEQDGDEINIVEGGGNYGWPVVTEGCTYGEGQPIGDRHADREDVLAPVHHWECNTGGFPPAGMTFYDGEAFPDWQGDLFVGNLAGQYLGRFAVDGRDVEELDPLLDGQEWRIRDVEDAPDTGELYVAIDAGDASIVRLIPNG